MKLRNLLPGFALALLMTLGIASSARATTYSSCSDFNNNIPTAPSGDVLINESGTCSLNAVSVSNGFTLTAGGAITASSISAAGEVHIKGSSATASSAVTSTGNKVYVEATGGNIDVDSVNSHGNIQLLADTGSATIKVHSSVTGVNGFQIFVAQGNIMLPAVTNNGGDVRIFANKSGIGTSAFKVGDGSTNGVDSVHTNGSTSGAIYISNGPGTGGIEYDGSDLLQVQASASRAGVIVLDGKSNGKVKLTGSLNVNGSGSNGAGSINIFAPEIISEGASLSANAPGHTVGIINLTTNKITLNANLSLNANGDGNYPDYVNLSIFPVDSYSVTAPESPSSFISFGPYTTSTNPLTITGDATLSIQADGNNNGIKIYGYLFENDATTTIITQQGSNNYVGVAGSDGGSTYTAATFGGTVLIGEGTSGSSDTPSTIDIRATVYSLSQNVFLDASGQGDGKGGNIKILASTGTIDLGDTGANFKLNASGGPTGGSAGRVEITGGSASVNIKTGDAIVASAPLDGDGGYIEIIANSISNETSAASAIKAEGKGSGNGGVIYLRGNGNGTLGLGSGTGKLSLLVSGTDGTGNGGDIILLELLEVTVSNDISVSAGTNSGGNGNGGNFKVTDVETFQITPDTEFLTLSADGQGSGFGGTIQILSEGANAIVLDDATLSASGDASGDGFGGNISVTGLGAISVNGTKFKANGGGSGGDAGTVYLGTYDVNSVPIDLSTAKIEARSDTSSGTRGLGGRVILDNATGTLGGNTVINVPTIIKVNGGENLGTSDFDGSISINGVTCQQWKTGATVFPKTAWDCITPDTKANIAPLVSAGTSLSPTLQGQLATLTPGTNVAESVGLYAMPSLFEYEQFFGVPHTGGYDNIYGTSYVSYLRVSMSFSYSSNGDNATSSNSPTIMVGALVHELGHELDYSWGPGLQNLSSQTAWINQKSPSFAAMDALPCNQVFSLSTCILYLGLGWSNSQIFDDRFSGIGHDNGELFAAMFEHVQAGLTGSPPAYSQDPELEKALDTLSGLKNAMASLISSPPTPTK